MTDEEYIKQMKIFRNKKCECPLCVDNSENIVKSLYHRLYREQNLFKKFYCKYCDTTIKQNSYYSHNKTKTHKDNVKLYGKIYIRNY